MLIQADTLDDLLHHALEAILINGSEVNSSRGLNRELSGVLLKLNNPRARLSHTEKRGRMFSTLGELAWYLSGSDNVEFVGYYIRAYLNEAESDGTIYGAYGPRLFNQQGVNQIENVIARLRKQPTSRRAAIQLYAASDLVGTPKDIPCTCAFHFLRRGDRLDMSTMMRSNDAFLGLPHDVFSFTMLHELIARSLDCELGVYSHFASSLHIYDCNVETAKQYLEEGWQATVNAAMPPMPVGDPWPSINAWLLAEEAMRTASEVDWHAIHNLDPYWQDLVRLLQVYRYSRDNNSAGVTSLRKEMAYRVYDEYIAAREDKVR